MEEKPIECFSCKKEATVIYKEILQGKVMCTKMCVDCPILKEKLAEISEDKKIMTETKESPLTCDTCHTTLESIKMGGGLGCPKCYEVFEEALTQEIANSHLHLVKANLPSFHFGKTPISSAPFDPSKQLESLHTSLNDALTLENYERAAHLRDEIKTLMEKLNEK